MEAEKSNGFSRELRWQQIRRSAVTSGPGIAWITCFLLVPLAAVAAISFMQRGAYGEIIPNFTLENYRRFFGFGELGFQSLYPFIILNSLTLAASTTVVCTLLGLPLAFFIAGLPTKQKNFALLMVMIPFWTNLLIRTYAWQILLSGDGPGGQLSHWLGFTEAGQALYPSKFAVYIGMVCDYLPYLVLPLYASVEKIDYALAEAAADLGANKVRVFLHAILPQIIPGLSAGITLVFIPASGTFVIPDLLGGARTTLLGNAIAQQFGQSRDWPFGSAIAFFGMLALLIALYVHARVAGKDARSNLI